ncbi:unnamed protein product [Didymodactylos carnosus]|uniref:Uncharacterized protein n=1 Tax=Didymodactylos carnosus TaxID=1234261 RepID=A0A815YTH8_9BILA|nr:unnamed protein product [Didymodactylos carnosus]CAF1574420.1 unnamed protein product [Didymodactylos carnosus]CAF4292665.1 unnamed protein product [Didymodactylos carnosus]CAF4438906.1 unnamed protein product [Didymodactylos carnosus]
MLKTGLGKKPIIMNINQGHDKGGYNNELTEFIKTPTQTGIISTTSHNDDSTIVRKDPAEPIRVLNKQVRDTEQINLTSATATNISSPSNVANGIPSSVPLLNFSTNTITINNETSMNNSSPLNLQLAKADTITTSVITSDFIDIPTVMGSR